MGGGHDSIYGGATNQFSIANEAYLSGYYTLVGGSGNSTLTFTDDNQTLGNSDFIHVKGLQAIQTGNGSNVVIAGIQGAAAGLSSLFGGTDNDLLDLSMVSNPAYLKGFVNLSDTAVDTLVGGTGAVSYTHLTLPTKRIV